MALEKDKLYARPALHRMGYTDARIDAAIASGELQQRAQFNIEEVWKEGKPEWKATRFSRPRKDTSTVPVLSNAQQMPVKTPKPKKAAPAKKQEQPEGVLSLGLGL